MPTLTDLPEELQDMVFDQVAAEEWPLQLSPSLADFICFSPEIAISFSTKSAILLVSKQFKDRYTSALRRQLGFEGVEIVVPIVDFQRTFIESFLSSLDPKERANISATGVVIYAHTLTGPFSLTDIYSLLSFNIAKKLARTQHKFTAPGDSDDDGTLDEAFKQDCESELSRGDLNYVMGFTDHRFMDQNTSPEFDRFSQSFGKFAKGGSGGQGSGVGGS